MNLPWGGGGGWGGEGGQKSYVHQHKKQDIFSAFGEFKAFTLLISCACEIKEIKETLGIHSPSYQFSRRVLLLLLLLL